jgi:ATP-binding cassette subfamily C protein
MVIYWALMHGEGGPSTGRFIAFSAAFTAFLGNTLEACRSTVAMMQIAPIYERLRPIVTSLPEIQPGKSDPGTLTGEIEMVHVSFRYREDGPWVLDDVSLAIRPGELVAVVGGSGSGKSTLLRLLIGFEQPQSGTIYYDGQDLAGLDAGEVRRQTGVVLQNGKLFTGDILSNIIGSAANLTATDALEAACMAGLDRDLASMPMGLHTLVSEGGATLSGGQRQRLLIARAIVHRPRILLLDEATSALDNRTQATVSTSIDKLEATRVVIAHRLSTILHADRIIVLAGGRIVQTGTYAELIKEDGPFAELARRQLA